MEITESQDSSLTRFCHCAGPRLNHRDAHKHICNEDVFRRTCVWNININGVGVNELCNRHSEQYLRAHRMLISPKPVTNVTPRRKMIIVYPCLHFVLHTSSAFVVNVFARHVFQSRKQYSANVSLISTT